MPTIQKPQLDHRGFSWCEDTEKLHQALLQQAGAILYAIGLRKKPHELPQSGKDLSEEEADLLRQCAGALAKAASITLDAGYKAPNKIIATLKKIEKNPSVFFERCIEPEARGILLSSYQRDKEAPGTHWYDLEDIEGTAVPDPQKIRAAAARAIETLKAEASKGRPKNIAGYELARQLLEIYFSINMKAGRRSAVSSKNGREIQIEDSRLVQFLELVIAPLNQFYAECPAENRPAPISATQLARVGLRERAQKVK
jgi:hypothetical protein